MLSGPANVIYCLKQVRPRKHVGPRHAFGAKSLLAKAIKHRPFQQVPLVDFASSSRRARRTAACPSCAARPHALSNPRGERLPARRQPANPGLRLAISSPDRRALFETTASIPPDSSKRGARSARAATINSGRRCGRSALEQGRLDPLPVPVCKATCMATRLPLPSASMNRGADRTPRKQSSAKLPVSPRHAHTVRKARH
jgi:hypothetical protein